MKPYLPEPQWSITDVVLVTVAGFVGSVVASVIAVAALGTDLSPLVEIGFIFGAQAAVSLAVLVYLSRSRGSGNLAADFGIRVRLADSWGIFAGLGLQIGVAILLGPILQRLGGDDIPQQTVAQLAESARDATTRIVIVVMIVIVGPVIEETVFRGMLLSRLLRSMSPVWAVSVSSLAWSALHLLDPNALFVVPGLFLIGLALGAFALRSGDLSLPIIVHAGVNLTAALLLMFSDQLQEVVDQAPALIRLLG